MKLLLLSNSTNNGSQYLAHAWSAVEDTINGVSKLLFVPYASAHHDQYTATVREAFAEHGISVRGLHEFSDQAGAIEDAAAVFVGGGNEYWLPGEPGVVRVKATAPNHESCRSEPQLAWLRAT